MSALLKTIALAGAACLAVGTGACAQKEAKGAAPGAREEKTADVAVTITDADGDGAYEFAYSGPFTDGDGNFDFTQGDIRKFAVKIDFAIGEGSVEGIKFMGRGEDAMWIALKSDVGDGSPTGPYQGDQFKGFATKEDGRRMHVVDRNDDGQTYRYALRFDLNGAVVQDDPDIGNGNGD